ncbi:hypothetical protein N5923_11840, partial [Erwiniaceae bacterium BAC15a-03b]
KFIKVDCLVGALDLYILSICKGYKREKPHTTVNRYEASPMLENIRLASCPGKCNMHGGHDAAKIYSA